jgi:prophage antirepressor-like protein
MENKALQVFNNPEFGEVRVVTINKEPWFFAKDVCDALSIATNHVRESLDEDEVSNLRSTEIGPEFGGKAPLIVSEAGLYSLILKSRKPEAKKFKRWVTHEVLPDIRKHGMYATQNVIDMMINDTDACIAMLTEYKKEKQEKERLQAELDYSKEWYSIKRVAKINDISWKSISWRKLKQASADIGIGVKKIFDANYGEVNTYHIKAWEIAYPELEL